MALPAVIAGHIALSKGRRVPKPGRVSWRPLFGTVLGYFNLALIALIAFGDFNKGRPNQHMAVCQDNLKRLQFVLREYADEHEGMYPPLSSQPGVLMFSPEAIAPADSIGPLLTCPTIRQAKRPANPYDDQSYFYLGYAVLDDDDVEAFARAYRKQIADGGTFDEDLVVEDGDGTRVLHRLSVDVKEVWRATEDPHAISPYEGREEYYQVPGELSADVPVLIERGRGHVYTDWGGRPRGANVLFLNTGVHFVARGTWPITAKTQRILAELAE